MVDYVPVLDRAVAALNPNTKEARRALYDRARRALVDGLRASDPTLSDTDLRTQSAALEAAIRRVEERGAAQWRAAPAPRAAPQPHRAPNLRRRLQPAPRYQPEPPPSRSRRATRSAAAQGRPQAVVALIAAAAAALALLVAGVGAYTFWPCNPASTPPAQRGIAAKRVEPEAAGAARLRLSAPAGLLSHHPSGRHHRGRQAAELSLRGAAEPERAALRHRRRPRMRRPRPGSIRSCARRNGRA